MRNATLILIVVFALLTSGNSFGTVISEQQDQNPFESVAIEQRDQLKLRLNEFVEYHRAKQWEKVYALLADQGKNGADGKLSRERFLKERLYSRVSRFTPKATQHNIQGDGAITIWGCATFARGGNMEAALDAYLQDGEWYFTDIWSVAPCVDCEPKQCKHQTTEPPNKRMQRGAQVSLVGDLKSGARPLMPTLGRYSLFDDK